MISRREEKLFWHCFCVGFIATSFNLGHNKGESQKQSNSFSSQKARGSLTPSMFFIWWLTAQFWWIRRYNQRSRSRKHEGLKCRLLYKWRAVLVPCGYFCKDVEISTPLHGGICFLFPVIIVRKAASKKWSMHMPLRAMSRLVVCRILSSFKVVSV